jgi:hypothetical protein
MSAESKTLNGYASPAPPGPSAGRLSTGWLAVVMSIFAAIIGLQLKQQYPFVHNFHHQIDSPILAVELPGCANDLKGVLGTDHPAAANPAPITELFDCSNKLVGVLQNVKLEDNDANAYPARRAVASLRTNTYEDFAFIVLYNLFLWKFAALFAIGANGKPTIHRKIMAGLVILTAAFDCLENLGILRALSASSLTDSMAQATRLPSVCKWGLFAVALLLTGWILVRSESPVYSLPTRRLLALAYWSAGALLFIGPSIPHIIELATDMFILLVLVNIVGLLGPWFEGRFLRANPPQYVEDFCSRKAKKQVDVAVYPRNS